MTRAFLTALLSCALPSLAAAEQDAVKGMIVSINAQARTFTASIEEIPGYMRAMTMPFDVQSGDNLRGLVPGAIVEFTLIVDAKSSHAERIRIVSYQSVEQDPFTANRLTMMREMVSGAAAVKQVDVGAAVPDFRLTNQNKRPITLSSLRGKLVVINFIYTSCALPNFCLRIANNFAALQRRFKPQLGRDLVLLTVTFDPVRDTPEVLAKYAGQWKADTSTWHFLTGPESEVQRVCRMFGVHAFPDEGLLDHSLHTAFIDRQGKLVANIEGNQFTAAQLGDLTERLLK